jgi:rod shape-determining protein MreD
MTALMITISILAFASLQATLPGLTWLGGLRVEILPALVAYSALTFRRVPAVAIALVAGMAQDSLSGAPFGVTALPFAIVAALVAGWHEWINRDLPWMQMIVGAITAAAGSFAACCVVGFSVGAVAKMILLALMSAVITPVLCLGMELVRGKLREARR